MPSWKDLKRFCDNDGWELYRDSDYYFYKKTGSDGTEYRTKISKGTGEILGNLWNIILKKQLQVTKAYFNSKI